MWSLLVVAFALCAWAKVPSVTDYHLARETHEKQDREKRYDDWLRRFSWMVEHNVFEEGKMYTQRALDSEPQNKALIQELQQRGWDVSLHRFPVRSAEWSWFIDRYDRNCMCRILRTSDPEDEPDSYRTVINLDSLDAYSLDEMLTARPQKPWYCPPCAAWCVPDWTVSVIKLHVPKRPRAARAVAGPSFITRDRTVELRGDRSEGTRFAWRQLEGHRVDITGSDAPVARFDWQYAGFYKFELTVYAGDTSDSAEIEVWTTQW